MLFNIDRAQVVFARHSSITSLDNVFIGDMDEPPIVMVINFFLSYVVDIGFNISIVFEQNHMLLISLLNLFFIKKNYYADEYLFRRRVFLQVKQKRHMNSKAYLHTRTMAMFVFKQAPKH